MFQIYKQRISGWQFVLQSFEDLEFLMMRLVSDDDGEEPIRLRFKLRVRNKHKAMRFEDTSDVLIFPRPISGQSMGSNLKRQIKVPRCFIFGDNQRLFLRCEIEIFPVDPELDLASDYHSLNNDLSCALRDEDYHDLFLHSGEVDYGLNLSMVKIRLPWFEDLMYAYDEVLTDENEDKCQFLERFTELHKRPVAHVRAATLARAIHKVITIIPPLPCCSYTRVDVPLETLQRSFTPGVCEALLSYVHSGSASVRLQRDVEGLSNVARCLQLEDLVFRLECHPSSCYGVSQMINLTCTFKLTSEHYHAWKKRKFEPVVKNCFLRAYDLPKEKKKIIVTLRLEQPDDCLVIDCILPEIEFFPARLFCSITIRNFGSHSKEKREYKNLIYNTAPWSIRSGLKKKDFTSQTLSFVISGFFYHPTPKMTCHPYNRFAPDRGEVDLWNVLRLKTELGRSFFNDYSTDVVLVAQGQKLEANIFILSARSKRFKEELRRKRFLGYKCVHLVPRIEYSTLMAMVLYLYTGETYFEDLEMVQKLLSAAEKFGVPSLVQMCQHYLEHKT